MITLNKNPKRELLLGAGFDVLHQESKEWLEIVAFWKFEAKFFADLLEKKEAPESNFGQVLKTLDKIHKELFDYLTKAIVAHENYLSRLVELDDETEDNTYLEEHKKLSNSMALFTQDFKEFKMMVFGFVKKL